MPMPNKTLKSCLGITPYIVKGRRFASDFIGPLEQITLSDAESEALMDHLNRSSWLSRFQNHYSLQPFWATHDNQRCESAFVPLPDLNDLLKEAGPGMNRLITLLLQWQQAIPEAVEVEAIVHFMPSDEEVPLTCQLHLLTGADRELAITALQALHRERMNAYNSAMTACQLEGKPLPDSNAFGIATTLAALRLMGAAPLL